MQDEHSDYKNRVRVIFSVKKIVYVVFIVYQRAEKELILEFNKKALLWALLFT
jgi:hypothetical protein